MLSSTAKVIKDSLLLGAINDGAGSGWDVTPYRTDWTETPWDETAALLEGEYITTTAYDALNRPKLVLLPRDVDGFRRSLVPAYNRAGMAEKVTFNGTEYVKLMAYDAKGQLSLAAFDNELMARYAYDPLTFRLKRTRTERYEYTQTGNEHEYGYLSGNVRQDLVYDYDLVGNILKQTNLAPDSGIDGTLDGADKLTRMFKYDPLYRLLEATGRESTNQSASYTWNEANTISVADNALNCRAYTQRYEYDKNGRITRLKHTANANNYTRKFNYHATTNRLTSIDNGQSIPTVLSSFTYDDNGNQTGANSERHYEYDAADMMRAYYNQTSAGAEPTVYAHYVYSGGTRVKKLVRTAAGEYEVVTYVGPFEYHRRVTPSGTEEKNYTQIVGGIEVRTGGYSDDIADTVVYSLGDHLGSVSTRVNSGRTIIDKEEYYPYGDSAMRTTDKKRYRYTGKEKDAESKLYYYGARYYTAWACTFTSVDPAAGATHYQSSYNYADCNPVVMNDPTGMQSNMSGNEAKDSGAGGTSCEDECVPSGSPSSNGVHPIPYNDPSEMSYPKPQIVGDENSAYPFPDGIAMNKRGSDAFTRDTGLDANNITFKYIPYDTTNDWDKTMREVHGEAYEIYYGEYYLGNVLKKSDYKFYWDLGTNDDFTAAYGVNFSIPTFLFNYIGGYEDKVREEPSGKLVNYVYSSIGSWRDIIGNDMVSQGTIPGGPGLKIPNFKEPYRSFAGVNIIHNRPIYYGRTPSGQTAWNNFQSKIKGFGVNSAEASKLYAATNATGVIFVNRYGKIVPNAYYVGANFHNIDAVFTPTIMLPVSNAQYKLWQTTLQSKVIFDYGLSPVLQNQYNEKYKD